MTWRKDDPQCNESAKIRWELVPYTRGYGYDLGCGPYKAFPHFIGVDNLTDTKMFGTPMQPDVTVKTCEQLPMFASQSADFVYSSHLLEHIKDYEAALKEWWRLVKIGGYLCLYLPHKKFYPNIGQDGANPDHKHDFLPEDIIAAMKKLGGFDLVENQEREQDQEYSFFQVYKKLQGGKWRLSCEEPKPAKTCAVVRYGAYGDLMMASTVFPKLKEQGYHLTLYTVPRAWEVIKLNPYVDRVILQDTDQVPPGGLLDFWAYLEKKYDKFVNLSESMEGNLLTMRERSAGRWPHSMRHKYLNQNYLQFHADIAEVPFEPLIKFYSTEEEKAWARKERQKLGDSFVILWSLAGSSVHKHYPHMDTVFARILYTYPNAKIITVGDDSAKILEAGWEKEPRVIMRSGVWTIRQSMSMIQEADLVIGPETGLLNAASFYDVPKIVFLSHSSVENLTRDWVNCISLEPKDTPCYPCHMMHYSFETCREGYMEINGKKERVGSLCQVNITPDQTWEAIKSVVNSKQKRAA
jgi:ADP-heptose:LPS heptosyltransferase/predicted SAM-dependent methyltransferase